MKNIQLKNYNKGFTLVELLVSLVVSGIILTGVYSAFRTQQNSYLVQEQVAEAQQNLRASIGFIARDLRMAGYDPTGSGNFSITDIRSRDLDNGLDNTSAGNPAITFQIDLNSDGILDTNETFSYSLYEYPVSIPANKDGIPDLSRTQGAGGRQLLGESIVAIGFAYSYFDADTGDIVTDTASVDINGDGTVDSSDRVPVWAIDSDNNNQLDLNIDTNKDGEIDNSDNISGVALPGPDISIDNIASVKIWLLAQTKQQDRNFKETRTFVLANKRVTPNDNFRHRLVEMTVKCRNKGL